MQKRVINKRRLTSRFIAKVQPQARAVLVWDSDQKGLALRIQPSGRASHVLVYRYRGRSRWFHIGDTKAIGLSDARKLAAEIMLEVIRGKDPATERRAVRDTHTFGALASRYVEEYAKKKNKSWQQAEALERASRNS